MRFLNRASLLLLFTFFCCPSHYAQESVFEAKSTSQTKKAFCESNSLWLANCPKAETIKSDRETGLDDRKQPNSQDPAQTQNKSFVFPTSGHRFKRYVKSTVGPFSLLRNAAAAGIDQWSDSPEEWEQGASGLGKRFGSNFGRNAIRQTVTYGVSEALRQDTGFERSKRKGFWPRFSDALVQNVTSRTRSGKRVPSAPIFAGAYASSFIAVEAWYPERYSYKDALRSGTYSLATGFAINVVREFVYNW